MESKNTTRSLGQQLSVPLTKIVDKHKDKISAMLASGGNSTLAQALGKDENVRRVASFCYPMLPFLLKIAVKEPAFVGFVMANRERVLARLLLPAEPANDANSTQVRVL